MKHFPTFHRHDLASCFNCGQDFGPAHPSKSGHAAGNGAFQQTCESCGLVTFYDLNCKPRIGDPVTYKGAIVGHVSSVEGNICNTNAEHGGFIWRFKDGLNRLHSWPGKDEALNA